MTESEIARSQWSEPTNVSSSGAPRVEVAVLAGGCFWGIEDLLRDVQGVIDTEVGYTGGHLKNPPYEDTHDGRSGHAEAIRVTFDPSVLDFEEVVRLDREYIERWSVWFDLKILLLTLPTVVRRTGAY